ncbi:MAG: M50 family metallopeptidase [Candidatus Accumulibacter sp.]|uniref:M50 family metallopeptidase n=1 Tax=Accumulibacter sp. TaxID=2053492 RepID=UPI001A402500|nr:M50 family metallopeptidase [Accumulibacter sp.]MBL8391683.1 M50 family metallopeptidase [Accumulibacter sp.]HRD88377.1 M50 family metallopeptidase [Accumulibacter sp.]
MIAPPVAPATARCVPEARQPLRSLLAVLLLIAIIWQLPHGRTLLYPLSLLATCAHELGHGVTAMLLGAHFERFALHADGSGLALWRGTPGRLDSALIAAGGLLAPSIAGSLLLILSRWPRLARMLLGLVGGSLVLVVAIWTRNLFGIAFLLCAALSFVLAAVWLNERGAIFVLRLTAAVLCLSWLQDVDYMFSASARIDGLPHASDTAIMAQALWLPYWFWGGVVATLSLAILALGLWLAVRAPRR